MGDSRCRTASSVPLHQDPLFRPPSCHHHSPRPTWLPAQAQSRESGTKIFSARRRTSLLHAVCGCYARTPTSLPSPSPAPKTRTQARRMTSRLHAVSGCRQQRLAACSPSFPWAETNRIPGQRPSHCHHNGLGQTTRRSPRLAPLLMTSTSSPQILPGHTP